MQTSEELRRWWERRRLRYNLIFIGSGVVLLAVLWAIDRRAINIFLLPLAGMYVAAMNVSYLAVWLLLILLNKRYSIRWYQYSLLFFDLFCIFSCLLNLVFAVDIYDLTKHHGLTF
jgi:hypothetical protein